MIKRKKRMGRPVKIKNSTLLAMKIPLEIFNHVKEIAQLESLRTGRVISANELIREAIAWVYEDGERLRECFRRSRMRSTTRILKKKNA